ncbi:putative alpha-1,6-mannanase (GH76 family) [Nakamurella sp. UYEF19]|uniref:glycoside hydrolase family 76 protein n=1 Tax=Nakamurella sp. UYEF19 TaxID=1756392 RepID=UPI003392E655
MADWASRAEQAENAVTRRHLRRLVGLPGTALGVVLWPATPGHLLFLRWHIWWQAHLLDVLIDAWMRDPTPVRRRRISRVVASIRLRNLGRFTNDYYDDMAWIGLALLRAEKAGSGDAVALRVICTRILDAWSPPMGGIPWRTGEEFFNAPANGPAAILLARTGFRHRAQQMADWMDTNLRLPGSDLIADGFHPGEQLKPTYFTYCQGVVLGAELQLVQQDDSSDHSRIHRLVAAIDRELAVAGVLLGHGGGNGGLFTGILMRYLAQVAISLPGRDVEDVQTREMAGHLVLASAEAAWAQRVSAPAGPLFGPDWRIPALLPGRGRAGRTSGATVEESDQPERDLSVQLSGWMLMEAAALLERTGRVAAE